MLHQPIAAGPFRILSGVWLLALILASCASSQQTADRLAPDDSFRPERPIPYPIDIPADYLFAMHEGTRTATGEPGPDYWQNEARYHLHAEVIPEQNLVRGEARIHYLNRSPDTIDRLILELSQNLHKAGTMRKQNTEVTGGIELGDLSLSGVTLSELSTDRPFREQGSGYLVDATRLLILLDEPLETDDSVDLKATWHFTVPESGAGGRMGRSRDNLFFIAYWYPQVSVYDDVSGWFADPFLGNAEFYHGFADYRLEVTAPDNWLVMGTGTFLNPEEVLADHIYERYLEAIESDEVTGIVTEADLGVATRRGEEGTLTWKFEAERVRDVAFSVKRESVWDGTRAAVGDLSGDGETDYTHIHSFYRQSAPLWRDQAEYARHSIRFLSEYLDMPYPWPHMTSVEGEEIISGGMEYPMITVMGDYNRFGAQRLHGVTAHEFAHMWIPMIVSTNERRYSWMDEGFTTFNTHQAMIDGYPDDFDNSDLFRSYLGVAGSDLEGPIMRRSDFHYPGPAFGVASYPKPASVMQALKGLVGEEIFREAYLAFIHEWAWKHPYPWDFFRTVERFAGADLEWFWRSWYFETWVLDQAITDVEDLGDRVRVEVADLGEVPMPVRLEITLEDGTILEEEIPVDHWLGGNRSAEITLRTGSPVTDVIIDPEYNFPDVDRSNNYWHR